MTIDDGTPVPPSWRGQGQADVRELEPWEAPGLDLDRIGKWVQDPLKVVAENIRGLTLEQATKMADAIGDRGLRDKLSDWAIAYLGGEPLPKEQRRF